MPAGILVRPWPCPSPANSAAGAGPIAGRRLFQFDQGLAVRCRLLRPSRAANCCSNLVLQSWPSPWGLTVAAEIALRRRRGLSAAGLPAGPAASAAGQLGGFAPGREAPSAPSRETAAPLACSSGRRPWPDGRQGSAARRVSTAVAWSLSAKPASPGDLVLVRRPLGASSGADASRHERRSSWATCRPPDPRGSAPRSVPLHHGDHQRHAGGRGDEKGTAPAAGRLASPRTRKISAASSSAARASGVPSQQPLQHVAVPGRPRRAAGKPGRPSPPAPPRPPLVVLLA